MMGWETTTDVKNGSRSEEHIVPAQHGTLLRAAGNTLQVSNRYFNIWTLDQSQPESFMKAEGTCGKM